MIRVFNLHEGPRWKGEYDYVGRPSILGNMFIVGKDGSRAVVVEKYRQKLGGIVKSALSGQSLDENDRAIWTELIKLAEKASHADVNLVCYCTPLPCHADVLKRAIEWILKQPENRMSQNKQVRVGTDNAIREKPDDNP